MSYREPALAKGASFLQGAQHLGLDILPTSETQITATCPRRADGGAYQIIIDTQLLTWRCCGCDVEGADAFSLIRHVSKVLQ